MLRSKYLVGHVDYLSKVSGKLEKLPVAVSILGSARKSLSHQENVTLTRSLTQFPEGKIFD